MASDLTPDRAAINTATLGFQAPLTQVIEAVARAGFGGIAPWRREVEGQDARDLGQRARDAQVKITGYCRSTYLPALTSEAFENNLAANYRAINDAAALGAESFVVVCGGLPKGSKDLAAARRQCADAAGLMADFARPSGVRVSLEPLHPMYAADRSCLCTLAQAREMAEAAGADVGVCLDVYHLWWDPELLAEIARCRDRILGFHLCDWLVPTTDMLNDRGMMGDGVIDIPPIRAAVEAQGFRGLAEIEIFSSENWWKRPMEETLKVCRERLSVC